MRPRDDLNAARGDGIANRLRIRFGINERIRRSQLLEPMHIAIADHRFPMTARPSFGRHVEIDAAREHAIPFNGVEQLRMFAQKTTERAAGGKEGVRGNHEPVFTLPQPDQILERLNRLRGAGVIEEEDVTTVNRPLDSRNEDDAAGGRVSAKQRGVELSVMKRDRERIESEFRSPVDKLMRLVRNSISWIVRGMSVEIDFQHRSAVVHDSCRVFACSQGAPACKDGKVFSIFFRRADNFRRGAALGAFDGWRSNSILTTIQ